MTPERFQRTALLLGDEALDILAHARVAVFGLGGVGGYVVEALARSGVGTLDLVDHDTIDATNINRQIIATDNTVGQQKTNAFAARIHQINPACIVHAHTCFYLPETASEFDFSAYDYVVDAVDTVTAKLSIITEAKRCGTPVISSMGAANKMDPTRFQVADISKTSVDPLAKTIRKELRTRGIKGVKVVYSTEQPHRAVVPDKSTWTKRSPTPASNAFVPPTCGLIIASEVVKDLIGWSEAD